MGKSSRIISIAALLAAVMAVLLAGLAGAEPVLSNVKITLSSGSILDANVIYCQNEGAEFLLEADGICYAFVFAVDPSGEVRLAFPNQGHPFNMLSPNQTMRVPDSGYSQGVGVTTGWAALVAVASDDPSWAYSFNEFYAPGVWNANLFSAWAGQDSSAIEASSDGTSGSCRAGISPDMRDELREEIQHRGPSITSEKVDGILAQARAAVHGYRFAFEKQRYCVASTAYATPSYYGSDDAETSSYSYSWYVFNDDLSPYGYWEFYSGYGYVWRPYHVSIGWGPYYRGRWVFTSYGWTWVSSDPWGWITCHYGYWAKTRRWGWVWLPGSVWSPARVSWYRSKGHVGWRPAPLPSHIRVSFEVDLDDYSMTYVSRDHFTSDKVDRYAHHGSLKKQGDGFMTDDGDKMERFLGATPDKERELAPGSVTTFGVTSSDLDSGQGRIYGYYRVEDENLRIFKPKMEKSIRYDSNFIPLRKSNSPRWDYRPNPDNERSRPKQKAPDKPKSKEKEKKKSSSPKEKPKGSDRRKAEPKEKKD
ncbi:MAG: DUF4384 domain-containing protein [Candidatus Coatesbacteria bacterium]|nr:DUF4384 domain-containing protein [Candidatus Coatesbacteria bacterium]